MSIVVLHNEALLVEAMQGGNEIAFTTLYWHYSPQLYVNIFNVIRDPVITEEIVQELFTRIWQKREYRGIGENFGGYIYRIGQHLIHDYFRKVQSDQVLQQRLRAIASKHYEHVEEMLHQQQSSDIVNKAINQLSPQQKKVYELLKVEDPTYKSLFNRFLAGELSPEEADTLMAGLGSEQPDPATFEMLMQQLKQRVDAEVITAAITAALEARLPVILHKSTKEQTLIPVLKRSWSRVILILLSTLLISFKKMAKHFTVVSVLRKK